MRKTIDENSRREGRPWSRLPTFSDFWRLQIRNSADFFGLNYYSSTLVESTKETLWPIPSLEYDLHLRETADPSWKEFFEGSFFKSVPKGLGHLLRYIKKDKKNWIRNRFDGKFKFLIKDGSNENMRILK